MKRGRGQANCVTCRQRSSRTSGPSSTRHSRVANADLEDLDRRLNDMGLERWNCYHVSNNEQGRVFYFKRRKSNAVAHLTNLLRAGAIAF